MQRWVKRETQYPSSGKTGHIWESLTRPGLSVEAHPLETTEEQDEEGNWEYDVPTEGYYVFPAWRGKGIPNSPHMTDSEAEALRYANAMLKMSDRELLGFGRTQGSYDAVNKIMRGLV